MATYQDLLNEEKTLTQKLQEKRATVEQANQAFGTRASSALKLGGQAINPADVFGQFSSFQRAGQEYISPLEEQLAKLRTQQMQDRQLQLEEAKSGLKFNPQTGLLESTGQTTEKLEDLLDNRKKLVEQGLDTTVLDAKLQTMGVDTTKLSDEEKRKASETQDTITLLDEMIKGDTTALTGYLRLPISMKSKAMEGNLKQLMGLMQLASAGKLKGQGQVSDAERKILSDAVSNLNLDKNGLPQVSDKRFKEIITKMRDSLVKTSSNSITTSTGNAFTIEEEK